VRKRNSFVQTLLSTPGCVLVINNLEVDAQPVDVLGQLMKFNHNKIHSVHIPPAYRDLNHAVAYVVFLDKESADLASAFLTTNFVVSSKGRPWIVSRCSQNLDEEHFGFPTLSAFRVSYVSFAASPIYLTATLNYELNLRTYQSLHE
jgi:hypothetical protein